MVEKHHNAWPENEAPLHTLEAKRVGYSHYYQTSQLPIYMPNSLNLAFCQWEATERFYARK